MKFALEITDLSYRYPGNDTPAISGISLGVRPGECICITGPSGCGKTTLLLAIQGLLKEGSPSGTIHTDNDGSVARIGMVFQNADTQILCMTVEDEVAFGPLNLRLSPEDVNSNIKQALKAVGLEGFERRNVEHLSAGEKHRLTIASVLSMHPSVLLLDEPTAQLDGPGKTALVELLKELKAQGHAFVIADHDLGAFSPLADRRFLMGDGALQEIRDGFVQGDFSKATCSDRISGTTSNSNGRAVATIEGLNLQGLNGTDIFNKARLTVLKGERVHLHGRNGVGKSTLLRYMAGLSAVGAGTLRIAGVDNPRPERLVGRIGFLFQNPEFQLCGDSVYKEVAYCLKRLGHEPREIERRVNDSLQRCGIEHLAERSPLTLSYGEQHRVALASVLAPRPEILLLDEPFSGLDFELRKRILGLLTEFNHNFGISVLIASHDPLPDKNWADRHLVLENGRIENV